MCTHQESYSFPHRIPILFIFGNFDYIRHGWQYFHHHTLRALNLSHLRIFHYTVLCSYYNIAHIECLRISYRQYSLLHLLIHTLKHNWGSPIHYYYCISHNFCDTYSRYGWSYIHLTYSCSQHIPHFRYDSQTRTISMMLNLCYNKWRMRHRTNHK